MVESCSAPEISNLARSGKVIWNFVRIALILGIVLGLLAGAVFFVFAVLVVTEGKLFQFSVAFAGGLASWFVAWLLGKGAANIKRHMCDRAIAEHAHAIRLDPSNAIAQNNQGVYCHHNGEYAKAIAHFDAARRFDPRFHNCYVRKAHGVLRL